MSVAASTTWIEAFSATDTDCAVATGAWSTVTVPLSELHSSRSILIPTPYPGLWNYWRVSPVQRGGVGDHIQIEAVERLQLTVTPNTSDTAADDAKAVEVESILLRLPGNH